MQALVLIALVILLFLQSVARHAHRVGRDPAVVRDHADRPLRDRPDAERVHAGRPDAGDGPPGRRRGRRARVDPPPPAPGDEPGARRRWRARNAVALPVLASTLTTMAVLLPVLLLAGLAQEAVRAAGAHGRGRDDRVVLRQHVRDAGRLPLLPGPRRARARRRRASPRFIDRVAGGYADALRAALPLPQDDRGRLRRAGRGAASGWRRACRARSSPRSTSRWSASTCASRPARRSRTRRGRSTRWARVLAQRAAARARSSWC